METLTESIVAALRRGKGRRAGVSENFKTTRDERNVTSNVVKGQDLAGECGENTQ